MSKREWKLLFEDIIDCINKIEEYIANLTFDDFEDNKITVFITEIF